MKDVYGDELVYESHNGIGRLSHPNPDLLSRKVGGWVDGIGISMTLPLTEPLNHVRI